METLYTTKGRALSDHPEQIPWDTYPRPLLKRDDWINLCGWWRFSVRSHGEELPLTNNRIRVPFPPETPLSGIQNHFPEGAELIYERDVELPAGFLSDRLLLHVGAADQHAKVYVDGKFCGSHDGGYTHFTMEIPDAPENFTLRIVVTDDLNDAREPYGKQRLRRGGMWYTPFSGLWQSVWMESVPADYVRSLKIDTDMTHAHLSTGDPSQNGTVTVQMPSGEAVYELKNGEANITPSEIRNWSPEDPYLYDFTLTLAGQKPEDMRELGMVPAAASSGNTCGVGDRVRSYFALRSVSTGIVDGIPRILLNGTPYFLHGLLDQGYWSDGLCTPADPSLYEEEIASLKNMGFNTLRKHIRVEPDLYYAVCDRLGMIVYQDMVNNGHYSFIRDTALPNLGFAKRDDCRIPVPKEVREVFFERSQETIRQLSSFPSILCWTIFNEGWGQFDSTTAYKRLKKLLPDVILDAASGWYDMGAGDVKSVHRYNGVYTFRPSHRPVVLSEFGGFSCAIPGHMSSPDKSYGYGAMKNPEMLTGRIERIFREEILPVIPRGLCGCIYTQVSDVEDEINGIFTYDRQVTKPDTKRLKALSEMIAKTCRTRGLD